MQSLQGYDLTEIELFRGLTQAELARVSEKLYSRIFPPGTNIITADQPGEVVYMIRSGSVKIHITQPSGTDVILAILGPGDIVGEMSMLDSAGRSANVVTLEECHLMWMGRLAFRECVTSMPMISQNLVRILSARVRLANELIQALASLDAYGRVARQVLAFADQYGKPQDQAVLIPLRFTQSDIADLVGASRKRVNQVMVFYKQQGFISVDANNRILVHNRKALASYIR